jgi:adenylate cyclase
MRFLKGNRQLKTLLLLVVAGVATGLAIAGYATHVLRSLDNSTVNTRFSIRGREKPFPNIVVVKIDTQSFYDLHRQWPFPRAVQGQLLKRIGRQHPAAIAFDVQFSDPSELGQNDDNTLLDDIPPGKVVFSNTEPATDGTVAFVGDDNGTKLLRQVGAFPGFGGFPIDSGGVIRRMANSVSNLQSLAVVTAQVATHRHPVGSVRYPPGPHWIDFAGPAGTFPSISYSEAYYGTYSGQRQGRPLPASFYTGKIVVIGATASNLQDIHPTSTDSAMPGVEIQANAIATVLRGFPLSSAPGWVNVALIVLLGVAVPLISLRLRAVVSIALALVIAAVFAVAVQLAFNAGVVLTFVYPIGALVLAGIGSLSVHLVTEAFERIRVRDLFSRFVPENVVDEVLASADGLRLGGIQREGTVMFTDLRGFTSFAESLSPSQVIDVLNHYLSEMSDAILDHGGTLVAYMGDGIMAVFGAPLPQPDHADRALSAAIEMLGVRLPRFNDWLRSQGLGEGFRMGIGLNSGSVMSGHVGSERRVEYTAVGDTTNTASRIEGMTKGTPHQLLLSETTREALRQPPDDLVFFDEVDIRGRVARMKLYGIREEPSAGAAVPAAAAAPGPPAGEG